MKRLEKFTTGLNRLLILVGGLFLVAMVILTCGNILLRIVWAPIPGTFELMGFFGALVAALALGYTQIKRGHIAVDVLIMTFSKKNPPASQCAQQSAGSRVHRSLHLAVGEYSGHHWPFRGSH